MKTKIKPLLIFLQFLILTIYAVREYHAQQKAASVFTGTIEVTKADITSKTSGYMKALLFKEGDFLTKTISLANILLPEPRLQRLQIFPAAPSLFLLLPPSLLLLKNSQKQ